METNTKVKVKRMKFKTRGRPLIWNKELRKKVVKVVAWPELTVRGDKIWQNNTDRDLAEKLGCSVPAVFVRRQKLATAGRNVKCKHEAYARAKCLAA
jgi:hypothetical protein